MAASMLFSQKMSAEEALHDFQKIRNMNPTLVMFFASTKYDLKVIGKGLKEIAPKAEVIGCSTAGEIISGRMLKDSVVVSAFDARSVSKVAVEVVPDLSAKMGVAQAMASLENKLGHKMSELDIKKYVGLILIDGLRAAEEKVMDTIGNLSDLTWIGGSAGDDLKFKETMVFANGQSFTNAAVLTIARIEGGFDIIKTQSFKVTGKKLVATEVDERTRTVISFNGKPAVKAYSEAVGYPVAKVSEAFMRHPLGLMVGSEPYVRSPQRVDGEKIVFYCNIKQGTELAVLESEDIVQDTALALKDKLKSMGQVSGIINFNCILRTLDLEARKQSDAYGKVFADVPTVGFSTYGEEYIGHINQTATMLLVK